MNKNLRMLILTALFAALTAIGAFLKIPFALSAITLQFFFTALAGVLLGPWYGALSQLLYVAIGLVGVPVFTQGGGIGYLTVPSFGFLLGLIPAAALIGALVRRGKPTVLRLALSCTAGLAVLYAIGLPYMALILNAYLQKGLSAWYILLNGMLLYLPGDAVKIVVVTLLGVRLLPALQKKN